MGLRSHCCLVAGWLLLMSFAPAHAEPVVFNHSTVGHGAETCLSCHTDKADYLNTMHPKKVQGPPTATATPVLRTVIDGQEVSIFDPRTKGYDTYVAPWAPYFNEANVEYTIGSKWKQRFMTQVVPATVDGKNYSGTTALLDNDYAVMGIQWNIAKQEWANYNGPTKENTWHTSGQLTRKQCGGCHTTGFDPTKGTWADQNSKYMQKGVTCESCHRRAIGGDVIRDPAVELTFTQSFELCGSCHGRGKSIGPDGVSAGQYSFPYSEVLNRGFGPGDTLSKFYIQTTAAKEFWQNGPNGTNANSKSHHQQYNDFLLSTHLQKEVGCVTCHGPHETKNPSQVRLAGNALCTVCHADRADPFAHRMHSAHWADVATCVDCHMPYVAKSMNPFDVRSHTFKIIPPLATVAMGGDPNGFSGALDPSHIPNSCNSSCHNGIGPGPKKTNTIAQLGLYYIRLLNGTGLLGDLDGDGVADKKEVSVSDLVSASLLLLSE